MCKNSRCSHEFAIVAARCVGSSYAVFPNRIVYRVEGDVVLVVAVIHAAQHDRRWKERAQI
jgi:hypothetical protein